MFIHPVFRRVLCGAAVSFPLLSLAGCSDDGTVTVNPNAIPIAQGNWQISSSDTAAAHLSSLSGALMDGTGKIQAVLHSQSTSACTGPSTALSLTGTEDNQSRLTLTGPLSGGTLTVTGTLAKDGKSLTNATYSVKGGTCAFTEPAAATVQNYAAVNGTYAGDFRDADNDLVAHVTANFGQSTAPDANGDFTLAGTVNITSQTYTATNVPLQQTAVTGDTFTFTYGDANCSVTAHGVFSQDAATLAVTSWTSSGGCGADTGMQSTMTRQPGS